jgi:alkylated DNA repair dioxygenase AlkB
MNINQTTLDLFNTAPNLPQPRIIEIPDGELLFYPQFFDSTESDRLLTQLRTEINWQQQAMKMYGKSINLPRLTAWYGDGGKAYTFSGIAFQPEPWLADLLVIKARIEHVVDTIFNSVLLNLYRSGQDGIGWHADNESELGTNPIIASISFGEMRRFQLRHRFDPQIDKVEIPLNHGSLLVMQGNTQHCWQHQVPKTAKQISERINLTFRSIQS